MEIVREIPFSVEQKSLLDMHSVLNLMNVIQHQLFEIDSLAGSDPKILELCDKTVEIADLLTNRESTLNQLESIDALTQKILSTIDSARTTHGLEDNDLFHAYQTNLVGIFEILKVRSAEILDRSSDPLKWVEHENAKLQSNFNKVFSAIEQNSKGSYRIINNIAAYDEKETYLVQLSISSPNNKTLKMPPVFQDVMRDLLANSRKYTKPGGTITAGLLDSGDSIQFVVQDSGNGIPEEEINKVVGFGYRASNNIRRPTMGGGFGLTKAYYITKLFGGKMWIDSPIENKKGTRIKITIPYPTST